MFNIPGFKKNAASLPAAVAGFIIILLFTRHGGIGIEPDSVEYLSTAQNLHDKGRLIDFADDPLVVFPAGYPFFLACVSWLTGLRPLVFAPVVNAMLFALTIYMAGYMMENFMRPSKWYKWAILSCIVISPALLEVFSMLMSESLFVVLEMLFFIAMYKYFRSHSTKMLMVAALLASFASVTRYAGITFTLTGGILLLLGPHSSLRKKITDTCFFSVVSILLLIINLVRNYSFTGTATGGRETSVTSLYENSHDAGSVLYDWLPFLQGHYKGAALLFILLIAALIFLTIKRYLRNGHLNTYEDITIVFVVVYLLFIVVAASISRFETIYSRFLAPVFIPLIWSVSGWMLSLQKNNRLKMRLLAGIVVFLLFQYGQLAWDYETWDGVKDAGIPGYTEDQWRYSETVLFIQQNPFLFREGYTVYSDANDAIYFFTGKVGKFLPHKKYIKGIDEFLADPHCYVVWFDDGENPDFVDKNFITGIKKMKVLRQFSDGVIYEYSK